MILITMANLTELSHLIRLMMHKYMRESSALSISFNFKFGQDDNLTRPVRSHAQDRWIFYFSLTYRDVTPAIFLFPCYYWEFLI